MKAPPQKKMKFYQARILKKVRLSIHRNVLRYVSRNHLVCLQSCGQKFRTFILQAYDISCFLPYKKLLALTYMTFF